jgi:RND family efflux transporter MFP subunit
MVRSDQAMPRWPQRVAQGPGRSSKDIQMRVQLSHAVWLMPILALLQAGCDPSKSDAQTPKAQAPPPVVTVAQPLKRLVANEEEQVGRFIAVDSVEVRARVSGYLQAIHFRDGSLVEKGAPLFSIDRRPFEIALEQARANLQLAESNFMLAESELVRAKSLVMGSTITPQVMDQREAAKRAAEAAVLAQKAAVRQAMLDLEFTELKAPVSGRIGDRRSSVGNFISAATGANSSLLATIQSIDPIRFEFTLDESSYLRLMRGSGSRPVPGAGLPVRLKLIDDTDYIHDGRMDFIDNAISRSSGTIRARAEVANPNGLFAPGMFARVRIAVASPTEALLIPDSAIGSEQVRKMVMVVDDAGVVAPKYVNLGGISDGLRVVHDGLDVNDRIVIEGLMRVRAGVRVDPKPGVIAATGSNRSAANAN